MSHPSPGQEAHRRGAGLRQVLGRSGGFGPVGFGCFAGFQATASAVRAPAPQRDGQADDEVLVVHVPAQQQHLDQGPGAVTVTVGFAGHRPPGIVDRGELAGRAGLLQRGRPWYGTRYILSRYQTVRVERRGGGPGYRELSRRRKIRRGVVLGHCLITPYYPPPNAIPDQPVAAAVSRGAPSFCPPRWLLRGLQ